MLINLGCRFPNPCTGQSKQRGVGGHKRNASSINIDKCCSNNPELGKHSSHHRKSDE